MPGPSAGNPSQREVILMFEPHRLEHHLLQSAYAILVPLSSKRLLADPPPAAAPQLPQQKSKQEGGAQ